MSDDTGTDIDLGAYDPRRANGLIAVSLPDQLMAAEFLMAVRRIAAQNRLQLRDAVLVVKNDDEQVVVQETIDPTPARSALSGGLWAGLLGLIVGGPIGWAVGLGVGAGVGAGVAKVVDLGIPDEWVTWFRAAVQPGTAAVVVLVEDLDVASFRAEVGRFPGAEILHTTLRAGALDELTRTD
jgi:uncharacterized membrane protein